jgi:hypothetical protein
LPQLYLYITFRFAAPFLNVFHATSVSSSILELTTLWGMSVYWLIAWGITKMFTISMIVSTPEAAAKLEPE